MSVDALLQLCYLTSLSTITRSAGVCFSESVDVTIVLANDQVEQILVIEAFAFMSLVADDSVVVQIYMHIVQVLVFQSVELFGFAASFRLFFHDV
jgi:hypothetical protein